MSRAQQCFEHLGRFHKHFSAHFGLGDLAKWWMWIGGYREYFFVLNHTYYQVSGRIDLDRAHGGDFAEQKYAPAFEMVSIMRNIG